MISEPEVIGSAPAPEPAPRRRLVDGRKIGVALIAVWAVAITAVVLLRDGGGSRPQAAAPATPAPSASAGPLGVPQIYEQLLPSMVRVEVNNDTSIGTGVIVNANGTILTANHVVAGANQITVVYADGAKSSAEVAGADPKQDTATLTPATLPETVVPAALGGGAGVGDTVVAIGNPLGLTFSTSSGVVSGLDRAARGEAGNMTGLIQFDAAVNPGNSGGPLLNDGAQVIGIVVSLANPTGAGTFIGIGFAVPIGAALGGGGEGDGRGPPL